MTKRRTSVQNGFSERVANLRKAAGFTQVEFAAALNITQRMVAYYEAPNAQPPAHLLPQMATLLGTSADVLLGLVEQPESRRRSVANRLEQRLLEIDQLGARAKRQIGKLLDSFIEAEKLKQQSNRAAPARARRTLRQEAEA